MSDRLAFVLNHLEAMREPFDPEDGIKDFDSLVGYLVEHGVVAAQPVR